jgi:electron transport complex protein RnfG
VNKHALAAGKIAGICLACILLVVLARLLTASAIERRGERETYQILEGLAPGRAFGMFRPVEGKHPVLGFYPSWSGPGKAETCIVQVQGNGYGGGFSLLAHCADDGEILGARLLDNREIPGMGKAAQSPEYMDKFVGTGAAKPVPLDPKKLSQKDLAAVSGVSVTYAGIARALEQASAFVKAGGSKK